MPTPAAQPREADQPQETVIPVGVPVGCPVVVGVRVAPVSAVLVPDRRDDPPIWVEAVTIERNDPQWSLEPTVLAEIVD